MRYEAVVKQMVDMIQTQTIAKSVFSTWWNGCIKNAGPTDSKKLPEYLLTDADHIYQEVLAGHMNSDDMYLWLTDLMDEASEYADLELLH